MENWELYLPPERKPYNPVNGQFLQGHTPHNKGKRWKEWAGRRAQKRMMKGWKNLDTYRPTTRPDNAGRCRKMVIAVRDDGSWCCLPFIGAAWQWVGGSRENVRRCCAFNLRRHVNRKTGKINTDHRYMGIRFYCESDPIWMEKVKQ